MHWVLILMMTGGYGGSSPAVGFHDFGDEIACAVAGVNAKDTQTKEYYHVEWRCVPSQTPSYDKP